MRQLLKYGKELETILLSVSSEQHLLFLLQQEQILLFLLVTLSTITTWVG